MQRGLFSEHLLGYWKGRVLNCIDPWRNFVPSAYIEAKDNVPDDVHKTYCAETVARLAHFGRHAQILRPTSVEAARTFTEGTLDFVFIDAQHYYAAVKQDLQTWYPKIKKGSLLCGHDWPLGYGPPHYGVKKAVVEFAGANEFNVSVSKRADTWLIRIM